MEDLVTASISFEGLTWLLESSSSFDISPNAIRAANDGDGNIMGRLKTWPEDLVNLGLLRAFGVTKFTGPCK